MSYELVPIDKVPEKIVVNGYFVSVHSPSENAFKVLSVDFTKLSPTKFYKMVDELNGLLSDIDEEHRDKKRGKGKGGTRRIVAEFIKAYKKRRELPGVNPYPQRFINIVNQVRTKLYEELNNRAIVIQSIATGVFRRNVYLLPQNEVDNFLKTVDKLNDELHDLRSMIDIFHEKKYFENILSILGKYGVNYSYKKVNIRDIHATLLPVALDPDVIKPYISKRVYNEIEMLKNKVVEEALNKFSEELRITIDHYKKLIIKKKFNPETAKKQLNKLREKIESLGLVSISPIVDSLMEMCNEPDKLVSEGYATARGKIKALIDNI